MDFGPALPPWLQQPQPQPSPAPAAERCRPVRSYNPLARDAASASTSESEHASSDDDDSDYDEEVRWGRLEASERGCLTPVAGPLSRGIGSAGA
jgi:hypothetical protein